MKRIWILNDLFVSDEERKKRIARLLISKVIEYLIETGRSKVVLSTAQTNIPAQHIYDRMEFVKDEFLHYEMVL